ncbi:MAG TPA: DNA-3-methyladenine glycosylase I [Solirubrobacteraceae bacterium]|jgi:DNA-3-methyladenine glycosylase I|nr:DNA-3-methyladenine glycosylase I [Solirubrobacteraceae bacterium]
MTDLDDGLARGADGVPRCWWCDATAEYRAYHDEEWGIPIGDDARLFETISLEGFQAGLSWLTILRKREGFRQAFAGFDLAKVARFDEHDVARLLADGGIVRHRGKIEAVINNAARALELIESEGSLVTYFWRFAPVEHEGGLDKAALAERALAPEAKELARDLKRRGWKFVGAPTVYAFMQAAGLVNDHVGGCFARERARQARADFARTR